MTSAALPLHTEIKKAGHISGPLNFPHLTGGFSIVCLSLWLGPATLLFLLSISPTPSVVISWWDLLYNILIVILFSKSVVLEVLRSLRDYRNNLVTTNPSLFSIHHSWSIDSKFVTVLSFYLINKVFHSQNCMRDILQDNLDDKLLTSFEGYEQALVKSSKY